MLSNLEGAMIAAGGLTSLKNMLVTEDINGKNL